MYTQTSKYSSLTPVMGQRAPSPLDASRSNMHNSSESRAKMDLHKFNDYLQERISKSAQKKQMQMSRRELSQKKISYQDRRHQITSSAGVFRNPVLQNIKESRIKKSGQTTAPASGWKKHESIEKLINKENDIVLCENRRTQSETQQSALRQLQRKYQELQQKYIKLMREATENARQFQRDKRELTKLKQLHEEDQSILAKLRKQLSSIHQNMKNDQQCKYMTYNNNQESMMKAKSEVSIGLSNQSSLQPVHQMWRSKLFQDTKLAKKSNMRNSRYKTTQNWTKNIDKSEIHNQFDTKNKPQQSRYYSAEKSHDPMRRSKVKKTSNHTQYPNTESKTSIKFHDSMKGSRVKSPPVKPATETLIRFENQFSSKNTPSTLHKKMVSSKPYSKYRFQPSYKME